MNNLKYFFSISFLLAMIMGCTKNKFEDVAFVAAASAPDKVAALFNITQDNTGLVTITPNGEGGATYDIFYGDGNLIPATVNAGDSKQHTYAEGVYNVKIVSHAINGKTTETIKQLTVSFKAPENLAVTAVADVSSIYKFNVTAKADFETMFKVYFGDVANEVPITFLEGETITHTYTAIGTYTIKVVALSGGAATTQFTKVITIAEPVLLPLTFESATIAYAFGDFGGGAASVIANPHATGINTTAKVGKMVKNPGEVYGGSSIALGAPIDFSANKVFRMKVYSPRVGAKVLLKVENATDNTINFEKQVVTTVANAWEDLVFDYSAINATKEYHHIVLIFDLGTAGDGTANYTFLFDEIRLTNTIPSVGITLPLDFESAGTTYNFSDFNGGVATVIANSHINGINTSSNIGKMVKNADQTWGGSSIALASPIDFSTKKNFKMKVYAPRVGVKVLLKVENLTNGAISKEVQVLTTTANVWEDLTFDFSTIDVTQSYQKITLIFENGTMGDGSANFTFFFDDIMQTTGSVIPPAVGLVLPIDFESTTITYAYTNFGGGAGTVANNPSKTGVNTSNKVGKMIKNADQTYGGSFLTLAAPINFSTSKIFKMKVFAPKVGTKVLLKVENLSSGAISKEISATTITANAWEELTFDFTGIDVSKTYQKVVLIFDLGTMGDGSANFTYFFDDIKLN